MLIIPTYEKVYNKKLIITNGKYCHSECDYKIGESCKKFNKNMALVSFFGHKRCRLCRKKYKDIK